MFKPKLEKLKLRNLNSMRVSKRIIPLSEGCWHKKGAQSTHEEQNGRETATSASCCRQMYLCDIEMLAQRASQALFEQGNCRMTFEASQEPSI